MIKFKFNEKKTTQAALLLLIKNDGAMSYMKLIKLLYLIDRDALVRWERPITGDDYFSMKRGPVLSRTLDIINSGDDPENNFYWYTYINPPERYEIRVKDHLPELKELNKREEALIKEVFDKFKDFDQWDMVNICHDILPEWEDVGNSSKPIEINTILRKENISNDDISRIEEEAANINYIKNILQIDE